MVFDKANLEEKQSLSTKGEKPFDRNTFILKKGLCQFRGGGWE